MAQAVFFGMPVSPGIGIGKTHFAHKVVQDDVRHIFSDAVSAEQKALRAAADQVHARLAAARRQVPGEISECGDVIAAQMDMVYDPKFLDAALARIAQQHICASWAIKLTVEELVTVFCGMDDPYLRDRAQDIRVLGLRLREQLSAVPGQGSDSQEAGVLLAEDLSPADIMELEMERVLGIVTTEGGPMTHTAIVSRGLHIPCLAGVTGLMEHAQEGATLIVDGLSGRVLLEPDAADLATYAVRRQEYAAWEFRTQQSARWPAETCDGVRVAVQANLDSHRELQTLPQNGADAVGLYRTEFAYFKNELPGEEELLAEYVTVAQSLAPRHVIFRTVDAGADKMLHAQETLHEANPALGLRGIRFCLRHPCLFRTQLRALMRAGVQGNVAIMLPMITTLEEVVQTRRILQELHQELTVQGLPHAAHPPLGVMIETPAAALICDVLARECDFLSIGTNDLVHYLLAIDRGNRHVASLNDPLHPAVIRTLKRIVDAAHREDIGVSVCGELASDPFVLALLLGMGVDAVSAAPCFLPGIKYCIRQLNAEECRELVDSVLGSTDVSVSRRVVREQLQQSLGPTLEFHTSSLVIQAPSLNCEACAAKHEPGA